MSSEGSNDRLLQGSSSRSGTGANESPGMRRWSRHAWTCPYGAREIDEMQKVMKMIYACTRFLQ